MIVNLNLFQNKYFVLTYLNYHSFSGQTAIVFSGVNGRYLELKWEIERYGWLWKKDPEFAWVGERWLYQIKFAILMSEMKEALPCWKQRASGNTVCHGKIILSYLTVIFGRKNEITSLLFPRFKKRVLIQHLERILEELEFNSLPNRVNHVNSR